jgi:hypothetical protein
MDNSKRQKIKSVLGWFFLFVIFTFIPFYFTLSLSGGIIFYLYLATIDYNDRAIYSIVILCLCLPFVVAFIGQKIGLYILSRFYTRAEMYKLLSGILRSKPPRPRRDKSVNQQLDRLYR